MNHFESLTMQHLETLTKKTESLDRGIKQLKQGFRVSWEDKTAEGGIVLAGGPTTITRVGTIINTMMARTSQTEQALLLVVRRDDDGSFGMIDAVVAKPAPDQC